MSSSAISITLSEWETLSAGTCTQLRGYALDTSPQARSVVDVLNKSGMLQLTELREGLSVSAASHVGRIRIGSLSITVLPKIKSSSLIRLLRYALGFQRITPTSSVEHMADTMGFEDLLVSQLNQEAQEIISRGLQRSYVRQEEPLSVPRGRIDINRLALSGGLVTAKLPCRYFSRLEDTQLNRVLLSGLRLAGASASDISLRRDSLRLASLIEVQVTIIQLSQSVLDQSERQMSRLTEQYAPVLSIIRMLLDARGVVLDGGESSITLPGFMFDMNVFFQELMSRFLKENLSGYSVADEHGLTGMMKYNPSYNPKRRRSPTPRPDYAIMKQQNLVSLVDAKYRDLWEHNLPRDMLYQLVVYAISQRELLQSSILYPASSPVARESRIDVNDPIHGRRIGEVHLRPVNLNHIEELISSNTRSHQIERNRIAKFFAFGPPK